jgi:hypothetical protein
MHTRKQPQEKVPDEVFSAVRDALIDFEERHNSAYSLLREHLTRQVAKIRAAKGWVFDKSYRHELTPAHSLIYMLVSTPAANSATQDEMDRFWRGYNSIPEPEEPNVLTREDYDPHAPHGDAWVYGKARVYGKAWVYGYARVYGDARVYGNARVYGEDYVTGESMPLERR